jgi:hypothetical protein
MSVCRGAWDQAPFSPAIRPSVRAAIEDDPRRGLLLRVYSTLLPALQADARARDVDTQVVRAGFDMRHRPFELRRHERQAFPTLAHGAQ